MSTVTLTQTHVRRDARLLAVALGVTRPTLPPLPLPPVAQRQVRGLSPLEASGWAADDRALEGRPSR